MSTTEYKEKKVQPSLLITEVENVDQSRMVQTPKENNSQNLNLINLAVLGGSAIPGEGNTENMDNQPFNTFRRQSIDSLSSYYSNDVKRQLPSSETKTKKKGFVIKKKLLKPTTSNVGQSNQLPRGQDAELFERKYSHNIGNTQPLQSQRLGTQQYVTDHSDSELSAFETQSVGGSGVRVQRAVIQTQQIPNIAQIQHQINFNQTQLQTQPSLNSSIVSSLAQMNGNNLITQRLVNIEGQEFPQMFFSRTAMIEEPPIVKVKFLNKITGQKLDKYHPFADKLSPFEEWIQIMTLAFETFSQFIIHDICLNAIYYFWSTIYYTLLLPIAGIGLILEYLRKIKNKCKRSPDADPFHKVAPPKIISSNQSNSSQRDLSDDVRQMKLAMRQQESLSPNRFREQGDFIIVIDLDDTLVYTQPLRFDNSKSVISMNDSYQTVQSLNLVEQSLSEMNGSGGRYHVYKRPHLDKFLYEMSQMGQLHIFTASTKSYADPVIDMIDPNGYITGRFYREHCKQDKHGNLVKPMELITSNLSRLIIIDDSDLVYNMYKDNTIKVPRWVPNQNQGKKQDKKLLECIDIVMQFRSITEFKDVRKNLRSIIDTQTNYQI